MKSDKPSPAKIGLRAQILHVLKDKGCPTSTLEKTQQWLETEENFEKILPPCRGIGKKSLSEIKEWLNSSPRKADSQKCFNCRFYRETIMSGDTVPKEGTCNKYAPRPVQSSEQLDNVFWPVVSYDDWCGEWSTK